MAAGDGIPGNSLPALGACGYGSRGCGVPAAAEYGISVVGLPCGSWSDDDVGALERRPDARRSKHELLQPLCIRRGCRLDLQLCRGIGCNSDRCRFSYDLSASELRPEAGLARVHVCIALWRGAVGVVGEGIEGSVARDDSAEYNGATAAHEQSTRSIFG